MVERGELEPKVARALATFARVALEAWALEMTGKTQAMKPINVEMIDFRSLTAARKDGNGS
jgi:hypothetical protein